MIEAVNSSVSSSAVLRATADQASTQRAQSANPARVQEAAEPLRDAPQVPYISPYIHLDLNYNKAVLQIRDSSTGDVVRQFPSEESLEVRRLQSLRQQESSEPVEVEEAVTPEVRETTAQPSRSRIPGKSTSADIITVQDVTSSPPANSSAPPQIATAAFSAGGQSAGSAKVSVLA
ncbi:MAG: flagellar protein FlaG [Alphaproteobacteria bacterium]|nr:flagellar protein FlaG [Alphaproteobacteria bacterium]QQS58473.1 MAG: flagellar protein FlaG [Alphaproteobacteria bacterium]